MTAQHSSASVEWYTPEAVIEATRVWGGGTIDLDPCSCPAAQARVKAVRWFGAEHDGLSLRWDADTVLCNPPGGRYGRESAAAVWWRKAVTEWQLGRARRILFVGFSLSILRTSQGDGLSALAFPICVPRQRLRFVGGESDSDSPTHDNVLIGISSDDLWWAFGHLGDVR